MYLKAICIRSGITLSNIITIIYWKLSFSFRNTNRNCLSIIFSLSSNAMTLASISKWNLLLYRWWWIIINSKKLFFIKAKNVMWWWFLFHCVLLFKRTLLSLSNRKAEKYSWGRKSDKLFSFESKLSIVFHPSIIGEYLFCLLQIFTTMGLFFQRKLCLKIDQANTLTSAN